MGKAKKGKKVDYDEDIESTQVDNDVDVDDAVNPKSKAKKTKKNKDLIVDSGSEDEAQTNKKKNKKKGKDTDVDEISSGVKEVSISKSKKDKKKARVDDSDEEVEVKKPAKGSKKKKGKESEDDSEPEQVGRKEKGGGGFSLLAMSDDDADDDQPEPPEEPEEEEEEEEVVKVKKDTKKAEKGGKKGKKKKKDEDEEDLEKILAELELEYSGGAPPPSEVPPVEEAPEPPKEEKKGKKGKKKDEAPPAEEVEAPKDQEVMEDGEEAHTVKTAAQKKKEKKEREKQKKIAEKIKAKEPVQKQPSEESETTPEPQAKPEPQPKAEEEEGKPCEDGKGEEKFEDDEDGDDKKKKKKKKGAKEEKEKSGKPNKKMIAAMQEALKKINEMEEKRVAEEAERLKKEEEAEKQRQEQLRLEQERKEKKKQKEKERKERLKAEGKLLSSKQKADRARAEAMIEAMKAMYSDAVVIPTPASKPKPKPFTKLKKKRPSDTPLPEQPSERAESQEKTVEVQIVDKEPEGEKPKEEVEEEAVKDSWDIESSGEDEEKSEESSQAPAAEEKVKTEPSKSVTASEHQPKAKAKPKEVSDNEKSSESEDSESESESDSEEEKKTDAERKREKALERIRKRHEEAEKKKSLDDLRAGVVCVLGHVDTGKTKILDKLRRTNVQDGEAGGITQQIGATNVPIDAIKEQAKIVKGFSQMELKIPGLLIIDTPGHESFSNLRSRGSSLCDIAILVVDIMHGLEPQTIESINLLKQRKTPFVVALNKIDRLYDWQTMSRKDIRDVIKTQAPNTQLQFEQRVKEVVLQFAEQGLNAALFYNNPDPRTYVSLVPTSAITGEGMGNLLALIVEICQTMLGKRLMYSEELQATVLEVKAIPGLGTTIDVILVNGKLREGDTIVLAGTEAPIVTQIRSLLMPQPLKELRVKNAYVEYKEIKAAQGAKIAGKDLEKVIAGLNLFVAEKPDEVEILKEDVSRDLKKALSGFKLQERGVYVQASTLGSLEALLEFLRTSSIPYANIRIGPVVKKDVMKASTMLEHDSQYAVILAFDVKIERDAQEMADNLGVKIFQADIIYHLFDRFIQFRDELKAKKKEEFKSIAVFPCKMRILPQFVFNSRDPIVMGVIVEAGIVKVGTPICVPSKDFVEIGVVTSIENNHKPMETVRKGVEVCVKIEPIPGESPKMFGRHFDETDILVSKISRQSIDACKDYFRDELIKSDWQLMVELKKLFQIL